MRSLILVFLAFYTSLFFPGSAQKVNWEIDFRTIFDNREGNSEITSSRTFFMTQLSPQIGLSLENNKHSVAGGIVWTQPIGNEWNGYKISPTLFYQYKNKGVNGLLGMFPRDLLYKQVPDYIWNDSTYYVQRNVRGGAFINTGKKGYLQAILDWRGMQTKSQREAFNFIFMGELHNNHPLQFGVGTVLMINHLALSEGAGSEQGVVDNILYNPFLTFSFNKLCPSIDNLALHVGILGTLTRDRIGDNMWKTPAGVWIDADFRWKWLQLHQQIYAGSRLFPYYQQYGNILYQGEPYFTSSFYSRSEIRGFIFDKSFISLQASLDFHVTSSDFMFYQRVILNIKFDGSFNKHK